MGKDNSTIAVVAIVLVVALYAIQGSPSTVGHAVRDPSVVQQNVCTIDSIRGMDGGLIEAQELLQKCPQLDAQMQSICADVTGDGYISYEDISGILAAWSDETPCGSSCGAYDIDANGFVDMIDLLYVLSQYGEYCGASSQCTDGIDNDGDGLIDWQYDLGCWSAEDDSEWAEPRSQEEGWTTFDPLLNDPDATRLILVTAFETPEDFAACDLFVAAGGFDCHIVSTFSEGFDLVRDNKPDWILLKRGETFAPQSSVFWGKSGLNENNPAVVSSYGAALDRPLIVQSAREFMVSQSLSVADYAITDLHITYDVEAEHFEDANAFKAIKNSNYVMERVLFEGIRMDHHGNGAISLQGVTGAPNILQVEIRRNAIFDTYLTGFFLRGYDNMVVHQNVIDYCAMRLGLSYSGGLDPQCLYVQKESGLFVFSENIVHDVASTGLQARSGGIIDNNYFARNPMALFPIGQDDYRSPVRSAQITNNVITNGKDMPSEKSRGWGIGIRKLDGALAVNNVISNQDEGTNVISFSSTNVIDALIEGNVMRDWDRVTWNNRDDDTNADTIYRKNIHWSTSNDKALIRIQDETANGNVQFVDNDYFSTLPDDKWFKLENDGPGNTNFDEFVTIVGETGQIETESPFVDEGQYDPNAGAYNEQVLGGQNSIQAFVDEALTISKRNYRPEYMADSVNDWIRSKFNVVQTTEDLVTECNDGIDNDNDGAVDLNDALCEHPYDNNEADECGNGELNWGELCDDGNDDLTDTCDTFGSNPTSESTCFYTSCGDGILQVPNGEGKDEECDDGNNINGDGCSKSCKIEIG